MAMKRLNVNCKSYKTSEWDVNSVKSYKAVHFADDNTNYSEGMTKEELVDALYNLGISNDGKSPMEKQKIARKGENWLRETYNNFKATHNVGSITNIHIKDLELDGKDDYTTILTYSFPCQDISLAGKQAGFDENSETRSSLLWHVIRLLKEAKEQNCLPIILLMENVNAIHNKKNIDNFNKLLNELKEIGYTSWWQDLNSKDYGVPQNRCRTFVLSILGDWHKDAYTFPEPIELTKRLKDVLEDEVDPKYYINTEKAEKLIGDLIDRGVLPIKKN